MANPSVATYEKKIRPPRQKFGARRDQDNNLGPGAPTVVPDLAMSKPHDWGAFDAHPGFQGERNLQSVPTPPPINNPGTGRVVPRGTLGRSTGDTGDAFMPGGGNGTNPARVARPVPIGLGEGGTRATDRMGVAANKAFYANPTGAAPVQAPAAPMASGAQIVAQPPVRPLPAGATPLVGSAPDAFEVTTNEKQVADIGNKYGAGDAGGLLTQYGPDGTLLNINQVGGKSPVGSATQVAAAPSVTPGVQPPVTGAAGPTGNPAAPDAFGPPAPDWMANAQALRQGAQVVATQEQQKAQQLKAQEQARTTALAEQKRQQLSSGQVVIPPSGTGGLPVSEIANRQAQVEQQRAGKSDQQLAYEFRQQNAQKQAAAQPVDAFTPDVELRKKRIGE